MGTLSMPVNHHVFTFFFILNSSDEKHYRELQVADEVQRKQLIQKAEEMIQKEKEGPRVLESTAKLCEVLKAREQQRKFRTEQEALQEARR